MLQSYTYRPKKALICSLIFFCFLLTVGCTDSKDPLAISKDDKVTLKVLCESEKAFYSMYGALFLSKFPNVDLQVVSMPMYLEDSPQDRKSKEIQFVETEQPDLLILSEQQFKDISSEGLLMDLDVLLKQENDKEQLFSGIIPTITDYLRSIGAGKLYGLSSDFNSNALYFNKDLFDKAGVAYPEDYMNWEDVLLLAQRFNQNGNESFGLMVDNASTPFSVAIKVGLSKGLQYVDGSLKQITISSKEWKHVFDIVLSAFKANSIYKSSESDQPKPGMGYKDILNLNPFISGKTAMVISGNYLVDQINDAKAYNKNNIFNWDIVTIPSDQRTINVQSYIWLNNVIAINSKAKNVNAAWQFMKYISSDEYAKISTVAKMNNSLPSRKEYLKDDEGHNFEAFYNLTIASNDLSWMEKLPQSFYTEFNRVGEEEINKAYQGEESLDEALENLKVKGSQILVNTQ
jgi:multiple sugar transport system substrate-binding protein